MSEKHTPGPWTLVLPLDVPGEDFDDMAARDQREAGLVAIYMASRLEGRGVYRAAHEIVMAEDMLPGEDPEMEANARLIAAAPELLSLVKRFVALPSGAWHPERHAAEEAELVIEARAAIAKATSND